MSINNIKLKSSHFSNDMECKHVFIIGSPIVLFISRIIIDKYKIPERNIYLVRLRNLDMQLIKADIIDIKLSFFDKVFRKIFLFSLYGIRLRRAIEKKCGKFVLYFDWDNRVNVEILNSSKCIAHAYIEEGQTAFNNLPLYFLKKDRISQWLRLRRWKKSSDLMLKKCSDQSTFNDYFNSKAFAFFTLFQDAFPLIDKSKIVYLNDFKLVKKYYKPQLLGKTYIGLMCSPRRLKTDWSNTIKKLVNALPNKAVIKLHPEFYSDNVLYKKFVNILECNNTKQLTICNQKIIVEAEMLFEKKFLIGPLTSLEKYAKLFGSNFKRIEIY